MDLLTELHTNPTQVTGVVAFALSAATCLRTAFRLSGTRARLWRLLALAQAACGTEVLVGLRHRLHDAVDAVLQANGWYVSRTGLQVGLLAVALVLGVACVAAATRFWRIDRAAAGAAAGSVAALWLFAIEAISLHQMDAFMYAGVGPWMLIALLWAAAAGVAAASAMAAAAAASK